VIRMRSAGAGASRYDSQAAIQHPTICVRVAAWIGVPSRAGRSPCSMSSDKTALIIVDMLNTYEHEDAAPLKESALRAVPAIAVLLAKAREQDAHITYVNDNHGDWTAGRSELAERTRKAGGPPLLDEITPSDHVPFLLKARHSIFTRRRSSIC
jgi:Isochorismatase family